MAGIIPIKVNNLIQATQYTVLGKDDELAIVYKGNGKEYVVESTIEDEKYTLSSNFVDNLAFKTNRETEEILNILFVINRSYESYRLSSKNNGLKIDNDVVSEVVTYLTGKYSVDSIIAYLNEMNQYKLVELFESRKKYETIIGEIEENLSYASYSEYESEERDYDYNGVVYDEDMIDIQYGEKVFIRK